MAGSNPMGGQRISRISGWGRRARTGLVSALLAIAAGGCGGGAESSPTPPPPTGTPPTGSTGSVIVTVRDGIGSPAPGANVWLQVADTAISYRAAAGPTGVVEFKSVRTGVFQVVAWTTGSGGSLEPMELRAGEKLRLDLALVPNVEPGSGIARAWVTPEGISSDGRALEFGLQVVGVPEVEADWDPVQREVWLEDCTPDPANDAPIFRADCVSGPDGFDVAYAAEVADRPVELEMLEPSGSGVSPTPFAAALLMDQSANVIVSDPADQRLFAAKYFLNFADAQSPVVLAAFAADDAGSGRLSVLPQKPVTVFPTEDPRLTADGRGYFPLVDSLATLEGGAPALFPAVDRMLDFLAASPYDGKRAIVVLTDGQDDTCASAAECRQSRDALVAKSRATGVPIVTVAWPGPSGEVPHETPGRLAQGGEGGAAFWVDDPRQLAGALSAVRVFLGDKSRSFRATFRVESDTAGAFAPGNTVLGKVTYVTCPWDCVEVRVPFVLRIP